MEPKEALADDAEVEERVPENLGLEPDWVEKGSQENGLVVGFEGMSLYGGGGVQPLRRIHRRSTSRIQERHVQDERTKASVWEGAETSLQ